MKTSWDLSLILKSENSEELEKILKDVKKSWLDFKSKWEPRSDYLNDPKVLLESLIEYENLLETYGFDGGIHYYFELKDSIEQGNKSVKANINKVIEFSITIQNDIQFYSHRLSKVDLEKQETFLKDPTLKNYKHFLFRVFQEAKYLLSEEEEKVVNLLYKTSKYNWTQMVENFIVADQEEVLTEDGSVQKLPLSVIGPMIETKNQEVRESAYNAVLNIRSRWSEIAENEVNSILEYKKLMDTLRKYDRPESSRHLADDIDTEVVDAMVKSVSDNFSIVSDFFSFKKNLLQKEKLKAYESLLGVEFLDNRIDSSSIKTFTFEEMKNLVGDVMNDLDEEFYKIYTNFFEQGRVDVYPKIGKSNGAFCTSSGKRNPTYILLNFTGKMQDCFTLAHETGHGINDVLARNQSELNFGTVLSTAEVASTFMEDFVWSRLYKEAVGIDKFVMLMQKIEDNIATIFIQVACYMFEQQLHIKFREKGYLSKEDISEIFLASFKTLYGDSVEIETTKLKWVTWSHIRTFFYVYSYASGLLISKSLQASVKKDKNYIKNVKEFLSSGTSQSPRDIFMNLGIDITKSDFWDSGLNEIKDLIEEAKELSINLKLYENK